MAHLLDFGFNNVDLWRSEEMQLVQVTPRRRCPPPGGVCDNPANPWRPRPAPPGRPRVCVGTPTTRPRPSRGRRTACPPADDDSSGGRPRHDRRAGRRGPAAVQRPERGQVCVPAHLRQPGAALRAAQPRPRHLQPCTSSRHRLLRGCPPWSPLPWCRSSAATRWRARSATSTPRCAPACIAPHAPPPPLCPPTSRPHRQVTQACPHAAHLRAAPSARSWRRRA